MSLLITSIAAKTLADVKSQAERAFAGGTDAVEIRLDAYSDDITALAEYVAETSPKTWLLTCRTNREGGRSDAPAEERAAQLATVAGDGRAIIDFEMADWRGSAGAQRLIGRAATSPNRSELNLILSAHDFSGARMDLAAAAKEMRDAGGIAKVAYKSDAICDSFASLDLMHRHRDKAVAIAMGEDGLWSRVLAGKLGGFGTYCCLDSSSFTAPGQPTLKAMIDRYRWAQINESTRVFGVLGDPIHHSVSPALMNRWFSDAGLDAVYMPLRVRGADDCLHRFLDGCVARPWLNVGGFSVTLPHKVAALEWVGGNATEATAAIGAANTLVFCNGRVEGHNTDCQAAIESMAASLGCTTGDLRGLAVDVLGTGGAARAVLAGLREAGCNSTVYGRSPRTTDCLAAEFHCRSASWETRADRRGQVLINCTRVGMWPEVDESPMTAKGLEGCRLVFDLIYNPLCTKLLADAQRVGAAALNGLDMFVRQAAAQFVLWTGVNPNLGLARDVIVRELAGQTEESA